MLGVREIPRVLTQSLDFLRRRMGHMLHRATFHGAFTCRFDIHHAIVVLLLRSLLVFLLIIVTNLLGRPT